MEKDWSEISMELVSLGRIFCSTGVKRSNKLFCPALGDGGGVAIDI